LKPIFHLSFPVRDLEEAIGFYTGCLGAVVGRREADWADIALFGAQVTLQLAPSDVTEPMPRTRHFGATIAWSDWEALTARLADFVEPPTISHRDTEREQAKAMLRDPSGNRIEIKAYRDPAAVLRSLYAEPA
jgi:uncharacterized protein